MDPLFTHIINPFAAAPGSEAAMYQPVTFESIRRAKEYAEGAVDVELLSVQFEEDKAAIPGYILQLPHLQRSTLDLPGVPGRKLPFVKDILESAVLHSKAEYIIYTNMDIALMPGFYTALAAIVREGYDGFIINRRCISGKYNSVEQLELMYSEAGKPHIGYDCFVFKKTLFSKFILGDVCTGIPHAWTDLAQNLFCFSSRFRLFTQKHLTFHIGMELYRDWGGMALVKHNDREYRKIVKALMPYYKIENIPGAGLNFFKRHFKWLMNPTFLYPAMLRIDLQQWGTERKPAEIKESRSRKNRYLEWLLRYINFD
jgi:hypothetical protein